ncbi:hypothetical protein L1285_21055 [Pseudoalteromonas sp. DL2-H2.2]|uniref:hypothetical protein n=1 Tax=Pseudoalteromonas sp. DL2-H2.2 TaxID=2908889 RepID=UPI001F31DF13|nr:hypothetical protein [Pseudoalteromonas sp. DL2-H2.2]MCF2910801.1 hypothetical protein [Pseudoalteromonas sp. DL2-H2.2]
MLRSDLKIFLPQRLGNSPDAGGHRTNIALESGKLNQVFSAISNVDRARSAFELVKLYPAVATSDASRLQDSHVFISDQPDDPNVTTLLVQSGSLIDTSVLGDMENLLPSAKFHGMTVLTANTASDGLVLLVDRVSANLAPTINSRVPRQNVSPPHESTAYRTQQLESFGRLYHIDINIPDLLTDRPIFYGNYRKYNYQAKVYETITIFQNAMELNGTNITTRLTTPVYEGEKFNLHYLSKNDFRYHDFAISGAIALANGESVLPGTVNIKHPELDKVLTDDGNGQFIYSGYLMAKIDYLTGEITEFQPVRYTGFVSQHIGAVIQTRPFTIRHKAFSLEQNIIPETFYVRCETAGGIQLSGSSDAQGVITGTNISGTLTEGAVELTFDVDVLPESISCDYELLIQEPVPTPPGEINRVALPGNGIVPIFHKDGLVCVQHRERTIHQALSAGDTITVTPDADWVDIVDGQGASLYSPTDNNYVYDDATGQVTVKSGVSQFTAPFILTVIQSDLVQVTAIEPKLLRISTPLKRTFPAGSTVSSVYMLEDLQARSTNERTLSAWQNNFADIGAPATNVINTTQYPIQLSNIGCITQRWAVVFTSTTEYNVLGEFVGAIFSGTISEDCAPINPFANEPYFIITSAALGSGLNPGEAFLFSTWSAARPIMATRSVSPGHSQIQQDSSTIAFRGVY